jgi:syntaxin 1B/2/3
MQMMVEEQGEILEQIELNAEDTTKDLEQGVKHVNKAVIIARSTRAVCEITFFFVSTNSRL